MHDLIRAGLIAAGGLAAGVAVGFAVWGAGAERGGFRREYANGGLAQVARVIDGDTVVLQDGMHVRYRGCDTPEVYRFIRDPAPLAEEATERNRELVEGAWVRLNFDPRGASAMDNHGRLLASVVPDGVAVAAEETLVAEGLARVTRIDLPRAAAERLQDAEAAARSGGLGIWGGTEGSGDMPFVASAKGRYVHRASCVYVERIAGDNLLRFRTIEAARSTGRRLCPTCFDHSEREGVAAPARPEGGDTGLE